MNVTKIRKIADKARKNRASVGADATIEYLEEKIKRAANSGEYHTSFDVSDYIDIDIVRAKFEKNGFRVLIDHNEKLQRWTIEISWA